MLEKDDERPAFSPSATEAVFRDERVSKLLREAWALLSELDEASAAWPADQTAFYAFFGEFLALFEASSFMDDVFSSLILLVVADPTLPSDFRTLLFSEHSDVLPLLKSDTANPWRGDTSAFSADSESLKQLYRAQLQRSNEREQKGLIRLCQQLLGE